MLLVDAIFINNGGGKVLLDYLLSKLEETNLEIHYLLDERILKFKYLIKSTNKVTYLNSSLKSRYIFYKKHRFDFDKVIVLGNIPPPIRINSKVINYFHNRVLLEVPKDFGLVQQFKYLLKVAVLRATIQNTDLWLVQTDSMRSKFLKKFGSKLAVDIVPFFSVLSSKKQLDREFGTFIYVSNAQENKNHSRLITAFCLSYDILKKGKLFLTVSEKFPKILQLIREFQDQGYPIINLGFIDREKLTAYYLKTEYVIYPSLSESFGLGLIEGALLGCKVIGSDLIYTYDVCTPSCTFDPNDIYSIRDAICVGLQHKLPDTGLVIRNEIDQLITLLS
ncbi:MULTISPECIES: glycosyltransferase [Sphingobacterium]|uniref:glycosyltransferase n=1 Tax=Sphingobacterium TaxID=28453 RepID=UPI002579B45D|nr:MULTISPECIES: glycosyltransferase [Sphingobacterium]